MNIYVVAGLASLLLGCVCIYLASPHQTWRMNSLPIWPARVAGVSFLVLGFLAFSQTMRVLAASFSFATSLMLLFIALPYLGTLKRDHRRK